ncbi:Claudin domain-containing 1 [Pelobates cultripes]|uniref:Claudin domain-containing 1, partial n=1 Tax=Pelobates cultripes TaxID=61616 RepID=A0AAD1WQ03_PELCU|nr:Claudin domain-containing 1 [Pelobates cultripes]
MDNRFATALVIGTMLSLLSVIYLSTAVGTVSWYHYFTPTVLLNLSEGAATEFSSDGEKIDEKTYTDALFHCNGSLGLWQICINTQHTSDQQYEGSKSHCIVLSFSDQFLEKYKEPGNHNTDIDIVRTYLWRCQFLLPLVALGLIFFGAIVGFAGCVCRSLYPALGTGTLHLLAGEYIRVQLSSLMFLFLPVSDAAYYCVLCAHSFTAFLVYHNFFFFSSHDLNSYCVFSLSHPWSRHILFPAGVCTLGSVLCFSQGVRMLQEKMPLPSGIRGEYGWSFCLACVSSPLQIMAGALFLWASRASRREYSLMKAYRVA